MDAALSIVGQGGLLVIPELQGIPVGGIAKFPLLPTDTPDKARSRISMRIRNANQRYRLNTSWRCHYVPAFDAIVALRVL